MSESSFEWRVRLLGRGLGRIPLLVIAVVRGGMDSGEGTMGFLGDQRNTRKGSPEFGPDRNHVASREGIIHRSNLIPM